MINKLKRLKLISFILRSLSPGFSTCSKCRLPWNYCEEKTINTSQHNGTFATCQYCWNNSELEELKSYYSMVYTEQYRHSSKHGMNHTRKHLLDCVEIEYKEDIRISRMKKIKFLKNKIQKCHIT